MFPASIRRIFL